jgi:hypothetical protein
LGLLSIVAQLGVACLMFLVGLFGEITGDPIRVDMMPWINGPNASHWLLGLGAFGVLSSLLAVVGRWRVLFVVWTAFVLWQVVGLFLPSSSYSFGSRDGFVNGLYLLGGAIATFVASVAMLRASIRKKKDRLV